jgi:hypothetical protein
MYMKRMTRHLAAWIGCVAILFAVLAPAVGSALAAPERDGGWSDICSAAGARAVAGSAGDDGAHRAPGPAMLSHLEHCPYCGSHCQGPALPPPAAILMAVPRAQPINFPRYHAVPRALPVWPGARPRAPPRWR